ncbi:MAG TPA: hypothetical protein DCQ64_19465 [Candidatus Rokubacteria bacterium]|nr:hypothetical protein [Candidatus Rokubacteria bacterium]
MYLHSFASSMADVIGVSERDVILHIVSMFHANAWCVPFAGVLNGSSQFFGGPNPPAPRHHRDRSQRARHRGGCGPHGVDRDPRDPGEGAAVGHLLDPLHPHRRVGGAQEPAGDLRQEVRRQHAPRLGHDGDDPDRHGVPAQVLHGGAPRRGALRDPRQAGPRGGGRGSPNRRRGGT